MVNVINIDQVELVDPSIVYSLYVPLGENGIIRLVDKLSNRSDVKLISTDLYYQLKIQYDAHVITYYSRGLIAIVKKPKGTQLSRLIEQAMSSRQEVLDLLKSTLTDYLLSLLENLGDMSEQPVHTIITTEEFRGPAMSYFFSLGSLNDDDYDRYRDELMRNLASDRRVKEFIGLERVIDSRMYEDVIIGTHGSIVRSEQLKTLLSFHAYSRSLHLFFQRYNSRMEKIWGEFQRHDSELETLAQQIHTEGNVSAFSGDEQQKLSDLKSRIVKDVVGVEEYHILTGFIKESIEFTTEKYQEIRKADIKENSFHIRKTLKVLADRADHLSIMGRGIASKAEALMKSLDIYDSEMSFEVQRKMERLAFISSIFGLVVAVVALVF